MIQSTHHHLRNLVEQCDNMSMTSSGTGLLVFSDDGTEDKQLEEFSKIDWTALHSTNGR